MEIIRWIGIALCGVLITLVLKAFGRNDIAMLCQATCGVLLLSLILFRATQAIQELQALWQQKSADTELMALLLRVTGITIAAELAAQFCRDAGVGALAQKVELGGKVLILCAAIPLLKTLCENLLALIV